MAFVEMKPIRSWSTRRFRKLVRVPIQSREPSLMSCARRRRSGRASPAVRIATVNPMSPPTDIAIAQVNAADATVSPTVAESMPRIVA